MTNSQLSAIGRIWQKKLCLQDWDIKFILVMPDKLSERSGGQVTHNVQHRRALIEICRPEDRLPHATPIECTIVHELLHIKLSSFCGELEVGSIAQVLEEQVINDLTKVITGHKADWKHDL